MSPHDYALKLLQIAEADEYAADKLIDDLNAADSIFGFHCQQAAENFSESGPSRTMHTLSENPQS